MRRLAIAAAVVLVLSCGHSSEEEKLLKAFEPVGSWGASLAFAGEQWLGNRVPAAFVRKSIEAARRAVAAARKEESASKAAETLRHPLAESADALTVAIDTLEHGLTTHDRALVQSAIARCEAVHKRIESLEPSS
jgi:hypothetical protein